MRMGVRGLSVPAGSAAAAAPSSGGDDEVEALLDRTMTLFRECSKGRLLAPALLTHKPHMTGCIHGKDVFEAFYKKVRGRVRSGRI